MRFSDSQIAGILATTGEDIEIYLLGVPTGQTIRGKFRKDFEVSSPFEAAGGKLMPGFLCATSAMADISSDNTFVRQGTEYRLDTKPQELPSGFTRVLLSAKR